MDIGKIDQIIDQHQGEASALIQILLDIQSENHWLPKEALTRVGEKLAVPMSRIQHITTFYKHFSLSPKGKHEVHVCVGTACHVRGAERILDTVREVTGVAPGETDPDLNFSIETVSCLGCCALGPVMVVDGEIHGNVKQDETAEVLQKLAEPEAAEDLKKCACE
ncbi:complex I 24 kDa subunit family protein [Geopsychrobacter electrodiphilus]|uniref:complex I 24 kDa subunit family protein n=1 Tax=Geopsychrobacter electrodiphilus TaxID=225196 RepID=UPI0003687730|nr:NAD(P)H-dependent oxidoreductase subunit E [Geopsychrobacter electrodiphilus]